MSIRHLLLLAVVVLLVVTVFLGLPFLPLWALNAVFRLGIPYTAASWFGSVVLALLVMMIVRGGRRAG